MKKNKNKKIKKKSFVKNFFSRLIGNAVFRIVGFVLVVGIIFFSIGIVIWEAKQFCVEKFDTEENEHVVKIQKTLFEMNSEMEFFEKELSQLDQGVFIYEEKAKEINKNIRSFSGKLNDIERYYFDRRFDYSLVFFSSSAKKDDEKFEQLKKLVRDGELFLNNMTFIGLSSQVDEKSARLAQYNFKVFIENYIKALELLNDF